MKSFLSILRLALILLLANSAISISVMSQQATPNSAVLRSAEAYHYPENWPSIKQEMINRGLQYDTAWEFYKSLESSASDTVLLPDEIPDWTGIYNRVGPGSAFDLDSGTNRGNSTAPLKGEYAKMYAEQVAQANAGRIWDPHSGCGQARGYPGILKNNRPHEFAVTTHQTYHLGWARNEVRRIYTDGRPHIPEEWAYETEHGDSIGFWEGDTLITHTMYTNGGWIGRVQPYFSSSLESVEIWRKVDSENIQADVWIYDSEALETPWYTRQIFKRIAQEEGDPIRGAYWWNCHDPNNIVTETEDGGTTFLDFDFD